MEEDKKIDEIEELIQKLKEVDNLERFEQQYSKGLYEREEFAKPIIKLLIKYGANAVNPLVEVLNDYETWSCIFAAEILGEIRDEQAIIPLIKALRPDGADFLREAVAEAIKKFGDSAYIALKNEIENIINDEDRKKVDLIFPLEIISNIKTEDSINYLFSLKDKIDSSDMDFYCLCLGNTNDKRAIPILNEIKEKYKKNLFVKAEADDSLSRINGEEMRLTYQENEQIEKIKKLSENFNPDEYLVIELCKEGTGIDAINESNREAFFPLLLAIEEKILNHFEEDFLLEDKDIIISLKKVRDYIFSENIDFNDLEKDIISKIKRILLMNDYSKKDVSLSISAILNSVKLHRAEDGKRGYLNFIIRMFDEMRGGGFEGEEDWEEFDDEEDSLWEPGGFVKSIGPNEMTDEKMKTIHMNHDEDVNYDCKKCGKKISAHNRDWHEELCDVCFNKEVYY